jgi:hypothetical protein
MTKWILYCAKKDEVVKNNITRVATFDDIILKIESGLFLVLKKDKEPNEGQSRFLVRVNGYPIIVPFNERGQIIQLITLFPDRNFK